MHGPLALSSGEQTQIPYHLLGKRVWETDIQIHQIPDSDKHMQGKVVSNSGSADEGGSNEI
jgi:hypothetical protein